MHKVICMPLISTSRPLNFLTKLCTQIITILPHNTTSIHAVSFVFPVCDHVHCTKGF